ncbi:GGDEF domain-containing protein [Ectothiorhodospira sp. BSL-9]|uniref:GGDEF domain-containing protein n=1 Tax=Ectothiorhodospira sp. BSL-9 TaxID=1442136 RepID=UPI0007B43A69|nr:GGDEF domain-containing protein [Ectothiorhodospira sp. BSL-9]ANB03012.1 hypothetical protein ECTOBSL9_2558 [Ectothiorhodospira sp. BSL-9]
MLLNNTDSKQAVAIAEELRANLEQLPIHYGGQVLRLTVSIGVAGYGTDGRDLDTLTRIADERLYQAKGSGRNSVCGGPEEEGGVALVMAAGG